MHDWCVHRGRPLRPLPRSPLLRPLTLGNGQEPGHLRLEIRWHLHVESLSIRCNLRRQSERLLSPLCVVWSFELWRIKNSSSLNDPNWLKWLKFENVWWLGNQVEVAAEGDSQNLAVSFREYNRRGKFQTCKLTKKMLLSLSYENKAAEMMFQL